MSVLMDLHLHTHETVDAPSSTVEAMCQRAVDKGVREIAFTNHLVLGNERFTIAQEAFRRHVEDIQAAEEHFPGLTIRLGLEVDYFADKQSELQATLAEYQRLTARPMDFIMGSIHHLWGEFYTTHQIRDTFYARHSPEELYPAYFELLADAISSGLFQVIAHPDCIKKGAKGISQPYPWDAYRAYAERAIDLLVSTGVAVEINTRGLQHACAEMYPSEPFLATYVASCRAAGRAPRVTLGSDAHNPASFGFALEEGAAFARRLGIDRLCTFERGHLLHVPLDDETPNERICRDTLATG